MTTYEEIDRKKRGAERKYRARCRRMLMAQIQPVLDYIDNNGDPTNPSMIANKLDLTQTTEFYTDLYSDVGVRFATDQYNDIIKRKSISDTVRDSWLNEILNYMRFVAGYRITSINKTSRKRAVELIRRALAATQEAGLGLVETRDQIVKYVGNTWADDSLYRAERIARTEVLTASNRGSFIGAKATGLNLKKKWLASTDGRERTTHREANQQIVEMDDRFTVGSSQMMIPGDASAPADETINCRCVVRYITDL